MKLQHLAVVSLAILSGSSAAQSACAVSGVSSQAMDPSLTSKILTWVKVVEAKYNLKASNWRGFPAKAPTETQRDVLALQALTADWERSAAPGSADAIFRAAVLHGVNVQYETLMVTEDAAHAQTHQGWADVEAARANACLALIRQP